MISHTMLEALNRQINRELYSAYLYLSMSSWFSDRGLLGFANWMQVQVQEEQFHAMKLYDYCIARGGRVTMLPIEAPPNEWESPLAVFEATYAHEQRVTRMINDLVDLAMAEKDHATTNFLLWYVDEQVEEEANDTEIIGKLQLIGDETNGLFMLDKELGTRVFTPPVQGAP
ncbi:ferritin [Methanofollis aquaemaris]|uniref:Ferritin n=1 Tax=Methanofollis aquaemaris TaxID=126734 RepID=A0A8A3S3S8_9EURY|nr:ferritin [Methanofollis aquaemaris]QSZ66798.1 ferritin [Methanofollis aquaemaris]